MGKVGVDKKVQTAEHFVITTPWAGKVRSQILGSLSKKGIGRIMGGKIIF